MKTLSAPRKSLKSLGIQHGDTLFMKYGIERSIPGPPRSTFETRPFGAHMDVQRMVAAQTRIERQEAAACSSVSFDADAVHAFQSYVSAALAFSIKRGGILYGAGEGTYGASGQGRCPGGVARLHASMRAQGGSILLNQGCGLLMKIRGWLISSDLWGQEGSEDLPHLGQLGSTACL